MSKPNILILGGGVIGLSIADHLARKGVSATLVEKGLFAREASWAGAGYLDLRSAARVGGAFFNLCRKSYDLFPEWVERLQQQSGEDPEYLKCGSLDVAFNEEEKNALSQMEANLRTFGLSGEFLSAGEFKKKEPGLSPEVLSVFHTPSTAQVRPPRLTRALLLSLRKSQAILRELEAVEDFQVKGRRIVAVRTSKGVLEADQIVLASGAWSGLLAQKLGFSLPVRPVRGQVVLFRGKPSGLKHILFSGSHQKLIYLVPRSDGHIYVGSTLEEAEFDKSTTPEGMEKLKNGAERILPSLSREWIEDTWAGLRPGSQDGWPTLGSVPGFENLWIATGHFTHGILLSAVTGSLMAEVLTQDKLSFDWSPFALDRKPHPAVGL